MSEPIPVKSTNVAATISVMSAIVGFLILPIILAPAAIIAGVVGCKQGPNWSSAIGIAAGFGEIIWILVQWASAGLL